MANITNRRARFDYEILEKIEAGLVLVGTEVKALRLGHASLNEAYAAAKSDGIYLVNMTISPFAPANKYNHDPKRPRKILVTKKQQDMLLGAINRDQMTLIPLEIFFNQRGFAKCILGLGKGRKKIDKRALLKERDWNKQKARMMKR
jgi:SsrA-binding protein